MNRRRNLVTVVCIILGFVWISSTTAGEPIRNKAGEILKAQATDLDGNPTVITLERIKPERPYKLAYLAPPLYNPYFTAMVYGVFDEAERMRLPRPILLATKTYQALDQQASQVEDVLARGVDAILISPLSYEGSAEMVARAAEKVPIISVAQAVQTDAVSVTVETNNYESGKISAEYMTKESKGKAKVALLKGPPGASWSNERVQGLKDVFAKHPDMVIAAERWCSHERAETMKITEDFLQKVPDLDWIWAPVSTRGPILALQAAGKAGKVRVVSESPELREDYRDMEEGRLHLMVSDQPTLIGRIAIQEAIRVLNGDRIVKHIYGPKGVYTPETLCNFDESLAWAPEDFRP